MKWGGCFFVKKWIMGCFVKKVENGGCFFVKKSGKWEGVFFVKKVENGGIFL